MSKLKKTIFYSLLFFQTLNASADSRISDVRVHSYKSQKIYLSPGLVTLINFPCQTEMTVVGNEFDAKAQISPVNAKIVILNLTRIEAQATNLIVKCVNKSKQFVFDIVPSRSNHQDVVYVSSLGTLESNLRLIKSSNETSDSSGLSHSKDISKRNLKLIKKGQL